MSGIPSKRLTYPKVFKYCEYILVKPSGERPVGKDQTLLQVKDAEAKAKRTIEEADERQKAVVAAARRDAVEKIQGAEKSLKEKNDAAIVVEKKQLASQREELMSKGKAEASKIKARATERIPKAKSFLKEHFERTLDATTGANE